MRSICGTSTVNFINVKGKIIRSRCEEITDAKTEKGSYSDAFLHLIISVEFEVSQSSFRRFCNLMDKALVHKSHCKTKW